MDSNGWSESARLGGKDGTEIPLVWSRRLEMELFGIVPQLRLEALWKRS